MILLYVFPKIYMFFEGFCCLKEFDELITILLNWLPSVCCCSCSCAEKSSIPRSVCLMSQRRRRHDEGKNSTSSPEDYPSKAAIVFSRARSNAYNHQFQLAKILKLSPSPRPGINRKIFSKFPFHLISLFGHQTMTARN